MMKSGFYKISLCVPGREVTRISYSTIKDEIEDVFFFGMKPMQGGIGNALLFFLNLAIIRLSRGFTKAV